MPYQRPAALIAVALTVCTAAPQPRSLTAGPWSARPWQSQAPGLATTPQALLPGCSIDHPPATRATAGSRLEAATLSVPPQPYMKRVVGYPLSHWPEYHATFAS